MFIIYTKSYFFRSSTTAWSPRAPPSPTPASGSCPWSCGMISRWHSPVIGVSFSQRVSCEQDQEWSIDAIRMVYLDLNIWKYKQTRITTSAKWCPVLLVWPFALAGGIWMFKSEIIKSCDLQTDIHSLLQLRILTLLVVRMAAAAWLTPAVTLQTRRECIWWFCRTSRGTTTPTGLPSVSTTTQPGEHWLILSSHWSILLRLSSHWSILSSHWLILSSHWSGSPRPITRRALSCFWTRSLRWRMCGLWPRGRQSSGWGEYWPLIGQYWSRDLNAGLWLVNAGDLLVFHLEGWTKYGAVRERRTPFSVQHLFAIFKGILVFNFCAILSNTICWFIRRKNQTPRSLLEDCKQVFDRKRRAIL